MQPCGYRTKGRTRNDVAAGSYVSIPAGVAHKYVIDNGRRPLFVSFDAPAYDSSKTLYLE